MSFCVIAIVAAMIAVIAPTVAITTMTAGACSTTEDMRASRYSPLVNGLVGLFVPGFRQNKMLIGTLGTLVVAVPFAIACYLFMNFEESTTTVYYTWMAAGDLHVAWDHVNGGGVGERRARPRHEEQWGSGAKKRRAHDHGHQDEGGNSCESARETPQVAALVLVPESAATSPPSSMVCGDNPL